MAWSIISTLNAPTSGAFTFSGLTLTSYRVIRLVCSGITVTTDGTDVAMTFSVSGSEVVTGYRWAGRAISSSATANPDDASAVASILLVSNDANWDVGNAATKSYSATITVDAPTGSTYKRAIIESAATGPTGNVICSMWSGLMENTGAIDGFKIKGTSNLTAGKVRLLGLS